VKNWVKNIQTAGYNVARKVFCSSKFDNLRNDYVFLLKKSENQDNFLKPLFFDLQKCVIVPQKHRQKNRHSILK
jgi:hypothetical protein